MPTLFLMDEGSLAAPTYSAFYCPGCTIVARRQGTTYTASTVVSALGAHNRYGDPLLSTSGTPPTLALTSASGSAYDTGTALAGFAVDYAGTARPLGGAWDIGASEFNGGAPTPTPTATPTNTPAPASTPTWVCRTYTVTPTVTPPTPRGFFLVPTQHPIVSVPVQTPVWQGRRVP